MTDPSIKMEMDQNFFRQLLTSQSDNTEKCLSVVTGLESFDQPIVNHISRIIKVYFFAEVTNGHCSILKVVESLNDIINNEDLSIRRSGIDILTTILAELPDNLLNTEEIKYFVDFHCCLLLDHHSFIPFVLKGLLALVSL